MLLVGQTDVMDDLENEHASFHALLAQKAHESAVIAGQKLCTPEEMSRLSKGREAKSMQVRKCKVLKVGGGTPEPKLFLL